MKKNAEAACSNCLLILHYLSAKCHEAACAILTGLLTAASISLVAAVLALLQNGSKAVPQSQLPPLFPLKLSRQLRADVAPYHKNQQAAANFRCPFVWSSHLSFFDNSKTAKMSATIKQLILSFNIKDEKNTQRLQQLAKRNKVSGRLCGCQTKCCHCAEQVLFGKPKLN